MCAESKRAVPMLTLIYSFEEAGLYFVTKPLPIGLAAQC